MDYNNLIERLVKRAEIRRQIPTRKSVQENKPDRLADLLDEAAEAIGNLLKEKHKKGIPTMDGQTTTKPPTDLEDPCKGSMLASKGFWIAGALSLGCWVFIIWMAVK